MDNFLTFFTNGWHHIVDIKAYDHLLFVVTLCATFKLKQWKQILIIVTAFTIGHSLTLIISSLDYVPSNPEIVELLIPVTIMFTAMSNVINYQKEGKFSNKNIKYAIALIFGLIHGLAFASGFKIMMFNSDIILPLFAFNLGIEVGQLFIVAIFTVILFLYSRILNGEHSKWNTFISGAGFGIAATILIGMLT